MSEETEVSEGQIREAISMRAGVDKSFRTALKEDAKAAIEGFIGTSLPEGLEVVVLEDSSTKTHVVLPEFNDELTDEQLEAIAGGFFGSIGKAIGGLFKTGAKAASGLLGGGSGGGGGGGGGINQSGQNNTSCIGKGGLVNSSMKVSGGSEVS